MGENTMTNYDYLYDKDYYRHLNEQHFVDKALSYSEIPNGTVLPWRSADASGKPRGGVTDENGIYREDSSLHYGWGSGYDVDASELAHCHETVIYLGMFVSVWGHCLTDNLRRLWFLHTEIYEKNYRNCRLVYVPADGFRFGENYRQVLDMMGFDCDRFVPIEEPTQFDNIICPDECFYTLGDGVRYFTREYRALIDRVREYGIAHQTPLPFSKVYFSYASYGNSKQIGENRIADYFKQQGYTIIAPEKLSFQEQLNILTSCDSFASTIGSCSHNLIFLKDGTEVILIPRANYLTGYQPALDHVHELNITYIDATLSVFTAKQPWNGPFFYLVSDQLKAYFHDDSERDAKDWKKVYKSFKTYMRYGLTFGKGANPKAYRYYSDAVAQLVDNAVGGRKWLRYQRGLLKIWVKHMR